MHRQHYPFGGLKPENKTTVDNRIAVAPSALPLRGTETDAPRRRIPVFAGLHRQHYPFGGLKQREAVAQAVQEATGLHRQHYPFGGLKLLS